MGWDILLGAFRNIRQAHTSATAHTSAQLPPRHRPFRNRYWPIQFYTKATFTFFYKINVIRENDMATDKWPVFNWIFKQEVDWLEGFRKTGSLFLPSLLKGEQLKQTEVFVVR